MAERQQALARVILKDPAVESLSSFIGVDGTNTTMNSGRILINLKPLAERGFQPSEVIRRLQPELAKVEGITLYMQPVQDLTVDAKVSRTQFQYTLDDPNTDELSAGAPQVIDTLQTLPELRDVSSDQQDKGLRVALDIDRATAARLRHHPAAHRRHPLRRLRPAPGLHDLHRAEPVPGDSGGQARLPAAGPTGLESIYLRGSSGGQVPLAPSPGHGDNRAAGHQPPGAVPGRSPPPSTWPRRVAWARR